MNRKYGKQEIKEVVKDLRETFQQVILTADIIAGFPGETEEDFEETYHLLEEIELYKIHAFPYSQRKNTKAATFENQIPPEIKNERTKKLIDLSNKIGDKYRKKQIGKTLKVLIEEQEKSGAYKGHTANYLEVKIKTTKPNLKNQIIETKIIETEKESLIGEF